MFSFAKAFNGDISAWDVANCNLTWEICLTEQKALIKTYQDGMFSNLLNMYVTFFKA